MRDRLRAGSGRKRVNKHDDAVVRTFESVLDLLNGGLGRGLVSEFDDDSTEENDDVSEEPTNKAIETGDEDTSGEDHTVKKIKQEMSVESSDDDGSMSAVEPAEDGGNNGEDEQNNLEQDRHDSENAAPEDESEAETMEKSKAVTPRKVLGTVVNGSSPSDPGSEEASPKKKRKKSPTKAKLERIEVTDETEEAALDNEVTADEESNQEVETKSGGKKNKRKRKQKRGQDAETLNPEEDQAEQDYNPGAKDSALKKKDEEIGNTDGISPGKKKKKRKHPGSPDAIVNPPNPSMQEDFNPPIQESNPMMARPEIPMVIVKNEFWGEEELSMTEEIELESSKARKRRKKDRREDSNPGPSEQETEVAHGAKKAKKPKKKKKSRAVEEPARNGPMEERAEVEGDESAMANENSSNLGPHEEIKKHKKKKGDKKKKIRGF